MEKFYMVLLNYMLAPLCLHTLNSVKAEQHGKILAWFIKLLG